MNLVDDIEGMQPCLNHGFHLLYLRNCDVTLLGKFFLCLLTRIRVGQMRVEILVEDFCCLLAEITPLPPGIQKSGPQNHDSLTGALLKLGLDRQELAMDHLKISIPVYVYKSKKWL